MIREFCEGQEDQLRTQLENGLLRAVIQKLASGPGGGSSKVSLRGSASTSALCQQQQSLPTMADSGVNSVTAPAPWPNTPDDYALGDVIGEICNRVSPGHPFL